MPKELALEIARQGEARLNALMALATAADLRATTLSGIFGAASVATGAAVLTYYATSTHLDGVLIASGVITAIGLFASAIIAALAGAPRDFYISGGNPDCLRAWLWNGTEWRDENQLLEATALRYADLIAKNKLILESGSQRIITSLIVAGSSPIIGVVGFFAYKFPCY